MFPEKISFTCRKTQFVAAGLFLLACLPLIAEAFGNPHYVTLFTRIVILATVATSLNLLIGFAGMVSLGHALFFAIGAYAVAIPASHGITDGWTQLLLALLASGLVALATGVIAIRTSGMAFIMITLAFAQMFFFLMVSLRQYGGDDGLSVPQRSDFDILDLASAPTLFYVAFAVLLLTLYGVWRTYHSSFGYVLRGARSNERRMRALGFAVDKVRIATYVASAMIAAVGGLLFANLNAYVSPSYAAWTVSGDLVLMIVLGGAGTVLGPLVGAIFLLLFETWAPGLTEHWMLPYGLAIVAIVLSSRHGIYGSIARRFKKEVSR